MSFRILTDKEHKKHKHLCRRNGYELNLLISIEKSPCRQCSFQKHLECLKEHAIVGHDAEQRLAMERTGVNIDKIFEDYVRSCIGENAK